MQNNMKLSYSYIYLHTIRSIAVRPLLARHSVHKAGAIPGQRVPVLLMAPAAHGQRDAAALSPAFLAAAPILGLQH